MDVCTSNTGLSPGQTFWTFPSTFLSYLGYREVLNCSLSSFKDFTCPHKKSGAHALLRAP